MRQMGQQQEAVARDYLKTRGLTLVKQNFSSRFGEIDLIMLDEQTLCFIEVRYRQSASRGGAAASITRSKQQKIIKTAQFFLLNEPKYQAYRMRFDTLLIEQRDQLNWIKGAFYART